MDGYHSAGAMLNLNCVCPFYPDEKLFMRIVRWNLESNSLRNDEFIQQKVEYLFSSRAVRISSEKQRSVLCVYEWIDVIVSTSAMSMSCITILEKTTTTTKSLSALQAIGIIRFPFIHGLSLFLLFLLIRDR